MMSSVWVDADAGTADASGHGSVRTLVLLEQVSWCCVCGQTRLMAQQKQQGVAPRYTGLIHALTTIPREEGIKAMWKGLLPRLMRIPPGQAIVWAVSDQITGYFEKKAIEDAQH